MPLYDENNEIDVFLVRKMVYEKMKAITITKRPWEASSKLMSVDTRCPRTRLSNAQPYEVVFSVGTDPM